MTNPRSAATAAISRWTPAASLALLTALTLFAYLPAFRAGFIWDDAEYITENRALRSAAGLQEIWTSPTATPQFYPLTFTTFWVEYHLWGLHPAGYHAVNILLHATSAVLLWRILRRLGIPGAWLAAAIFAVHPVHVESVAWITERKNVLSGVFYFASLLAAIRFLRLEEGCDTARQRRFPWGHYYASLLLFIAALLSKTVTSSLPVILLLLVWWKRGRIRLRDIAPLIPFFIAGGVLGSITSWVERNHVGAHGPEWVFAPSPTGDLLARCLIAGRAVWFYVGKLLWPHPLMFNYPRWNIDLHAVWQYIPPAAVVAVLLGLFLLRRRIGRWPTVAALFFIVTLFPALGFVNVYPMLFSFVADHFQYLASLGVIVPAAAGIAWVCRRARAAGAAIAAILVAVLGGLTFRQARIYHDLQSLWTDTLAHNPQAWMAQTNYGQLLLEMGRRDEAETHLLKALELYPANGAAAMNLGVLAEARGQTDTALAWYRKAIELDPNFPGSPYHLAGLLASIGREDEALAIYARLVRTHPQHAPARVDYGLLLSRRGRIDEAARQFAAATRIDPDSSLARNNFITALIDLGRLDEAEEQADDLIARRPKNAEAYNSLGIIAGRRGRMREAIAHFRHALELNPNLAQARANLQRLQEHLQTRPAP